MNDVTGPGGMAVAPASARVPDREDLEDLARLVLAARTLQRWESGASCPTVLGLISWAHVVNCRVQLLPLLTPVPTDAPAPPPADGGPRTPTVRCAKGPRPGSSASTNPPFAHHGPPSRGLLVPQPPRTEPEPRARVPAGGTSAPPVPTTKGRS